MPSDWATLDDYTFTNDSLISLVALAEHFGISRLRLRRLVKSGKVRGVLLGGQWHVRWGDFKRWLVRGMLSRRVRAQQCPVCGSVFVRGARGVRVIETSDNASKVPPCPPATGGGG